MSRMDAAAAAAAGRVETPLTAVQLKRARCLIWNIFHAAGRQTHSQQGKKTKTKTACERLRFCALHGFWLRGGGRKGRFVEAHRAGGGALQRALPARVLLTRPRL